MRVKEIMTINVKCCTPETNLREVGRMMVEGDCGEIPVVDNQQSMKPIGVVTDRDITCRTVAQGKNPLDLSARDCMTSPVVTVTPDTTIEECCERMERHQIRRVPVVDQSGRLCGMIAQADLAKYVPERQTAEVVRRVSQPTGQPSVQARV
jgi:CBS domain-containing protein